MSCGLYCCIDLIDLELDEMDQQLSINGFITNQPEVYTVTIKRTGKFSDHKFAEDPVSGARIEILTKGGVSTLLSENSPGVYETNPGDFVGTVGQSYRLMVQLPNGKKYSSTYEELLPAPPIANLDFNFLEESYLNESDNITSFKKVDILVNTQIPSNPNNVFFKWDVSGEYEFREIEALTDIFAYTGVGPAQFTCFIPDEIRLGEVMVFDGSNMAGKLLRQEVIKSIKVDYKFAFNYCVHVKQYSLTRTAYDFWNKASKILNRDNSVFSESVGTFQGNMSNEDNPDEVVHGLFYASAVSPARMFVHRDSVDRPVSNCVVTDTAFSAACMDCLEIDNSTRLRPPYWPQ